MKALFRRDFTAFFQKFQGCWYLSLFFLIGGLRFYRSCILVGHGDLSSLYSSFFLLILLTTPLITADSFSKEQRFHTSALLHSAPLSLFQWVLGVFSAPFLLLVLSLSSLFLYGTILHYFTIPNWGAIFGNFFLLLLVGFAFQGLSLFASALSSSRWIAMLLYYGVLLVFLSVDIFALTSTVPLLTQILSLFSLTAHFRPFTLGIFRLSNSLFFFTLGIIFVFLTIRILLLQKQKVVE